MKVIRPFLILYLFILSGVVYAQEDTEIFVMEIRDQIDPRMSRYVKLALEEATNLEAEHVIIDMDTYGGAVNDADAIRTMILDYPKPVYVFINKNAASAGALISIACDSIYMADGSNIGAATVVHGSDGSQAPDKYQSYMRSMMRSTAEANGRDPDIAEAMVDASLEVEGVSEAGKVLTFTATEAVENGFCEAKLNSIDEVVERIGLAKYEVVDYEQSAVEKFIAIFLNPMISGILILVILGGIYYELQTPGVGFPIAAAFLAAILYFVPYYLNGLAENWEIILFFVGILLIALEIFVIPGFGIAGISGIICTLGGLVLVMLQNDYFDFTYVPFNDIFAALTSTLAGGLIAIFSIFIFGHKLVESSAFSRVALEDKMVKEAGYSANFMEENYIGKIGVANTILRPSGKVVVDGEILDATAREGYIEKGVPVKIIDQSGSAVKVIKG